MIYSMGSCTVDTRAYEVRRDGDLIPVEPQVFDLLVMLIENRGRLVTRDEIIERVWRGRIVSEAALSSRIKTVRQVIGDDGASQSLVRTIRGRGFRFVGEVREGVPANGRPASTTAQSAATDAAAAFREIALPEGTDEAFELPRDRPSLVVLPFRYLGDAGGYEPLLEGLVDEITSALARVRTFFVIARGSAEAFRGRDWDVREIARILGVRYVVQGSLRVSRDALRISVRLTDAVNREEVWSAPFNGELGDTFDVQDRITEAIVGVLQPTILVAEVRRVQRQRPENITAYGFVLQAMPKCWALNMLACADAMRLLQRAVGLDPSYALAHALLSWCHGQQVVYNWSADSENNKLQAFDFARRAASLDSDDPLVLIMLANATCVTGDIPSALAHVQRGLELDPNSSWGWNRSGWIHCYKGEADIAIDHFQRSLRLSPFDPMRHNAYFGLGFANFVAERYDEAIAWTEKGLVEKPDALWSNRELAASAALGGRRDRARRAVASVEGYAPWIRVADILTAVPIQNSTLRDRYRRGLELAGFKP